MNWGWMLEKWGYHHPVPGTSSEIYIINVISRFHFHTTKVINVLIRILVLKLFPEKGMV